MDIETAIIEFGTEAVRRYTEISQAKHDNELPEIFLGGFIACRLYDRFHHRVHVERLYTIIARELGIEISNELLAELGGLRADVAIYQDGLPSAIIELKIYDEGSVAYAIAADLFKAQKLVNRARLGNLRAYVGVMICETSNCSLENRTRKLEEAIHQKVYSGEAQQSVDGQWQWCFGWAAQKDPSA